MATYTVKAGDTLGTIAKEFYGDPMKYKEIAAANNIADPNKIEVGMTLTLPGIDSDSKESETTSTPPASGTTGDATITADQLQEIMPKASAEDIQKYIGALNEVMPTHQINTPMRVAQFIAQLAHESGSFRFSVEGLNYSAENLRSIFGKYFTTDEMANEYARKPEEIANIVYANRMGNGDTASGDGWRFRGRGLIQLTGKNNYEACGKGLNMDLVDNPDQLADDPVAAVAAATWYWNSRDINKYADEDDVRAVTKAINGGYNGLDDRIAYLERAKKVLGVS